MKSRPVTLALLFLLILACAAWQLPQTADAALNTTVAKQQGVSQSPSYRTFPRPIGAQMEVPDRLVDLVIDRRLSLAEQLFMHNTLLRIPPAYRQNVVYLTADGKLHANRISLL